MSGSYAEGTTMTPGLSDCLSSLATNMLNMIIPGEVTVKKQTKVFLPMPSL